MVHLAAVDASTLDELHVVRATAELLEPTLAQLCERAWRCFERLDDPPVNDDLNQFRDAEVFWDETGMTAARDAVTALAAHMCGALGEALFDEPQWLTRARAGR